MGERIASRATSLVLDTVERINPRPGPIESWDREGVAGGHTTSSRSRRSIAELKGNIVRAMLPFSSGHRRSLRVRGIPLGELRAPTAAIEKRGRHCSGAPVFLAWATTCRWAGSLGMALHAGLEVLRSGRGDWRGGFVSGGAEAQLRAHLAR